MNLLGTRMDTDGHGFAMRMSFYSPTDCTDGHGFYHADEYIFEHEICRRPTDQREVIERI